MTGSTLTHYAPHDYSDTFAYCGVYLSDARYHSPQPTCPRCAEQLAAECAIDQAVDEMPWPLDADEATAELDPVLNAGVPFSATAFVADLFEYAVTLNRQYAAALSRQGGRR
jgi:hypothetical protein